MFQAIFNIWYQVPVFVRLVISLLLIGVTVFVFFAANTLWPAPGIIGVVLLMFCGSGGNSKGYNF
jgi:hypothetical protein